jgi:RNA polymerase sigma-70 factor (ECF subfamily)
VAINTAIVFFKEREGKVDKYEIVSENIKEETDDSEVKESQEHFTKQFKKIDKAIILSTRGFFTSRNWSQFRYLKVMPE